MNTTWSNIMKNHVVCRNWAKVQIHIFLCAKTANTSCEKLPFVFDGAFLLINFNLPTSANICHPYFTLHNMFGLDLEVVFSF